MKNSQSKSLASAVLILCLTACNPTQVPVSNPSTNPSSLPSESSSPQPSASDSALPNVSPSLTPAESPNPASSPSSVPSQNPSPNFSSSPIASSGLPVAPRNVQIVRRDSNSMTISWEIGDSRPHTYRLLLDGKEVAIDVTGTSYTFTGLQADKSYRLDVQAVIDGQSSPANDLVGNTLVQGSTGTGGFSNGGGGGASSPTQPTPTLAQLTPASGLAGTTITLTGTNFDSTPGNNTVKFGAVSANVTAASNTSLTVTVPAGLPAGTTQVTVSVNGQTSLTIPFNFLLPPVITTLSPLAGPLVGGTILSITGSGFTDAMAVNFGTVPATSFMVNSATSISATAPAQAAGVVDVSVITPGGTSANTAADNYTYQAVPTLTSLSSTAGPLAGGGSITLTGTNFTGATAVHFGTTAATSFTVNSATSITATVPVQTAGTVNVSVVTPGGTTANTVADDYTYLAAPAITARNPTSGSNAGGISVGISGSNFTGVTAVSFGTTPATSFIVHSETSITAVAPAHTPGVVDITVTTAGGNSANTAADNFTYLPNVLTSSLSGTNNARKIIFANNQFVVAGGGNNMWLSADGLSWTNRASGVSTDLYSVTYGNNLYLAVGESGVIRASADGSSWTPRSSGLSTSLESAAYSDAFSTYIVVGAGGVILISGDATSWISRNSGTTQNLNHINYGGNQLVAVGNNGTILATSSPIIWSAQSSGTTQNLMGVTYGGGRFVAVGANGTILTSLTGSTWVAQTSGVTTTLNSVSYGNSKFVAVGANGTLLTSTDAVTWTSQTTGTTNNLLSVAYGNGRFVVTSDMGPIFTSDGL